MREGDWGGEDDHPPPRHFPPNPALEARLRASEALIMTSIKPAPGKHLYVVTQPFLLGHLSRKLVPGQDTVEYDTVTGGVWINGVHTPIPNIVAAIKAGWLLLASTPAPEAAVSDSDQQVRNSKVIRQEQSEVARIGSRAEMQARAQEMARQRSGDPSAAALAPARPRFEDGKVAPPAAPPRVRQGDEDQGTQVQGMRLRTPSNMGAMSVSTSHDPLKKVVADRRASAAASTSALHAEGITFRTTNISPAAADAVPQEEVDAEPDTLWTPEGQVRLAGASNPERVQGGFAQREAAGFASPEDFMFEWIEALRQLKLPVSADEHYRLIRVKFPSLPEWNFSAHWKTRVKQFAFLPLKVRQVLWLLEGPELLKHSADPYLPGASDLDEGDEEEEGAQEAPAPEEEEAPAPVAAPSNNKVKTKPGPKPKAATSSEGPKLPTPPERKLSSPRTKLSLNGTGGAQVEELAPQTVSPGGGADDSAEG